METIKIKKSGPLHGSIRVSGAKNAILPILAATLLTEDECIIHEIPQLEDVFVMYELLENFGAKIEKIDENSVKIQTKKIVSCTAPYDLITKMRASFLVMGSLLSRTKNAMISMPGGCAIGSRPIDLHLKGFSSLNVNIKSNNGFIEASTEELKGNTIYLDFPSVGATENIMMAACLADGITILENSAEEPEIVDLANFINSMGGKIEGAGTGTIIITGVKKLHATEYTVIPDRIEAGTYMIAALVTGGKLSIENLNVNHVQSVIAKLKEVGADITEKGNSITVTSKGQLKACDIKTLPYPGFPTDMQAQFMTLLSMSEGVSIINETIFENRFMHVNELRRLGAKIKIEANSAIIDGPITLSGAHVKATDLRAGASLILAGLVSEGETIISDVYHIKRGYSNIVEKLKKVGANIGYFNI
ncbi:UDP-N-acetylglucosamine 1-carboxyvinyltransferase [Sedimentibacter sp. zth1]|uniref:UDP-N-acetylglucosamine 1-carboxyvinyltransferase n=1 Tax=Sedimentibacter sp. zth1 TaxID=2816908 RepID=UPI001A934D5E|nr:UDP-N-acetylglucosamine 1-carboxyvinyltransferase [Sedimentibacter sp. zth1]QSX04950.1 UDP-N-acetylglucosamine 1-carboxyvinyltransferase [Sedimentibacter sp. zth1]